MNKPDRIIPKEKIQKINKLFSGYPQVAAVYLFGSYGTEFQLPSSDIDIGIVFEKTPDLKEELDLEAELSSILHSDNIDLVNLNRAPLNQIEETLEKLDTLQSLSGSNEEQVYSILQEDL